MSGCHVGVDAFEERQIQVCQGITGNMKGHINANNLWLPYRALKKVLSTLPRE